MSEREDLSQHPLINAQLAAEMNAVPPVESLVPDKTPKPHTFYGLTHAQQGGRKLATVPSNYTCKDCLDLEARLRKIFKAMGHEF